MPTTDQDARALTYLAKRLREETYGANRWDETGIYAVIAKLEGRNLPTVVEQVTRHASDPEAKTPGAINRPFLPDAPKAGRPPTPPKSETCGTCYERRDICRSRWADDHQFIALSQIGRYSVPAREAKVRMTDREQPQTETSTTSQEESHA